jgi:O-antigen/teichoic acid export membrane protein
MKKNNISLNPENNVYHIPIRKNFVFNFLIQLLTYIIPLITAPYLSRVLGAEGIGINSFVNSIASYFSLFVAFGFLSYGTKTISEQRNNKASYSNTFWNIFFSKGFLFCIVIIAYFLLSIFWGFGSAINKVTFLIYSLTIISAFLDNSFLFQGLENFRIISIVNITIRSLGVICVFLFIKKESDLTTYIIIHLLQVALVSLILLFLGFRKISKPKLREIHIFSCIKSNFFYFIPTIAVSIYTILDQTMLGYLSNNQEVAFYQEAYIVVSIVVSLIGSISPVMLSHFSKAYELHDYNEIKEKTNQLFELYGLMTWPCFLGLYLITDIFIPLFFGPQYANSIPIMYYLIPLVVFIPLSSYINNSYFLPNNKVKITSLFYITGAVFNMIGNYFIIPVLGGQGAAITSLCSELIISLFFISFSLKKLDYKRFVIEQIKPLISSFCMFGSLEALKVWLLSTAIPQWVVLIIVVFLGVIFYYFLLLIMKEKMVCKYSQIFREKLKLIFTHKK